jgi:DNA-binding transcriptional LysR family regulator
LTAPGARYYAHCVRLVEVAEQASIEISESLGRPTGVLSVTAPVNYGAVILSPLAVRFLDANPSLRIDILLVDRVVNMIEEGIDLAFRLGPLQDSNLIARGLKPVRHRLCATTSYLQGHPPAVVPEDLRHHHCLPNRPRESWLFERNGDRRRLRIKGRLSVNNLQGLKNAALAGMGIVHLPDYMCDEELRSGALEEVLKDWPAPLTECHAIYPSTRHLPLKVRSFLDFVVESMGHGNTPPA